MEANEDKEQKNYIIAAPQTITVTVNYSYLLHA